MDPARPHRPRVSRQTRLLFTTALVAVMTLWGLARVRFPDRPPPPNPVAPILTQLAARPAFDDLATGIAEVLPRVAPLLVPVEGAHHQALRVRPDAAVMLAGPEGSGVPREAFSAVDPASGLAIARVAAATAPGIAPWTPNDLRQPRYLLATDTSTPALTLRPLFVASLEPLHSPLWPGEVWRLPAAGQPEPGTLLFTTDARLAGLVATHDSRRIVVPAAVLLAEVDRLLVPRATLGGYVGIDVQPLTPSLSRATGATSGVVVTWVDPAGPAADVVAPGDVLEAADDAPLETPLHWRARAARLGSGAQVSLRVRRGGAVEVVPVVAVPDRGQVATDALGLTLNARGGTGSVVARVEPGSAAARAGLATGDVITRAGDRLAPTPAAVRRAYAAAAPGEAVLVALTRGDGHHVVAIEK